MLMEFLASHSSPSHPISLRHVNEPRWCPCRLRLCWDRVLDPAAKHVQLDKRVRGAQANVNLSHVLKPEPGADEAAGSSSGEDSQQQVILSHTAFSPYAPANMCGSPGVAAKVPWYRVELKPCLESMHSSCM